MFTGPLGTVRTLYTITWLSVNPLAARVLCLFPNDESPSTVANPSFMAWSHSTPSGTIGNITDLRVHAVVGNVDSALRM